MMERCKTNGSSKRSTKKSCWRVNDTAQRKNTSVNKLFTEVFMVTAAGFKPATPTSVVWYSIQLSYAAISFL